jgi:PAS domain S-box-containing protein
MAQAEPSDDESRRLADQRQMRQQAQMLDQASEAIVLHGLDRAIRYWNQGAERLFGWSSAQALGQRFSPLLQQNPPMSDARWAQLLRDGQAVLQAKCRAADERVIEIERRLTVIRDEGGQPTGVLSVSTDITERRAAEREILLLNSILESRVRQRTQELEESNEDLRTFAYSLAHDLRAPLGAIDGFSMQLERRLDGQLDDKSRHYLGRVRAGVKLMTDLTEALLSLAQLSKTGLLRQSVDLTALARAWQHRVTEMEPGRSVRIDIADTPRVEGDVRLLGNLLENLLGNAWKFSARRADAAIEFGANRDAAGHPVFFVRDNGAGFDPDYADKLFVPFQRLHSQDEFPGTGMGLAIARKIVQRHGGWTWGEPGADGGACFYFTLNEGTASE